MTSPLSLRNLKLALGLEEEEGIYKGGSLFPWCYQPTGAKARIFSPGWSQQPGLKIPGALTTSDISTTGTKDDLQFQLMLPTGTKDHIYALQPPTKVGFSTGGSCSFITLLRVLTCRPPSRQLAREYYVCLLDPLRHASSYILLT